MDTSIGSCLERSGLLLKKYHRDKQTDFAVWAGIGTRGCRQLRVGIGQQSSVFDVSKKL